MSDAEGTYTQLVELSQEKAQTPVAPAPPKPRSESAPETPEDLSTTPYISQNYRFTDEELRWLRRQSFSLTERMGWKVSQNTILRVALQLLRELYAKSPKDNPLLEALGKIKK